MFFYDFLKFCSEWFAENHWHYWKKGENYNISIFARCVNTCVNDVSQIIHSKIVKKL